MLWGLIEENQLDGRDAGGIINDSLILFTLFIAFSFSVDAHCQLMIEAGGDCGAVRVCSGAGMKLGRRVICPLRETRICCVLGWTVIRLRCMGITGMVGILSIDCELWLIRCTPTVV
ncbi:hypothetical protein BDW42DRAFT_168103 [Aspergillus taichungensis]|uniref:Uncharacterized protein n=1 Tax=Aspergillus taichungensis TaxID=482145 RepID=A0A2J5HWC7_9EURO|nr:hypothetical protein BDW42DRAFT_168103 [Aspergillus taichungensis]